MGPRPSPRDGDRLWHLDGFGQSQADPGTRASLDLAHPVKARERVDRYGYVEPGGWIGAGSAHSDCGTALVGSAKQILT
jgi:hypothetical protein